MSNLRRWNLGRYPDGPFTLNRRSKQANGLVAWWPALASSGLGLLRDLYGGYNGSLNGITWQNTIQGPAMGYASGSYVDVSPIPPVNPHIGTVSMWVLVGAQQSNIDFAFRLSGGVANNRLYLMRYLNSENFQIGVGNVSGSDTGLDFTIGAIQNIVLRWDNGDANGFLNGVKGSDVSYTDFSTIGTTLRLGNFSAGSEAWDDAILEARIYERALSDSEIWQLSAPSTRWELYQPVTSRSVWFVAEDVGQVDVAASLAALAANTLAATSEMGQASLAASLADLLSSGQLASVATGAVGITAGLSTLLANSLASTSVMGQANVLASLASLVSSGLISDVVLTGLVRAAAALLQTSSLSASAIGGQTVISTSVGQLLSAGLASNVSVGTIISAALSLLSTQGLSASTITGAAGAVVSAATLLVGSLDSTLVPGPATIDAAISQLQAAGLSSNVHLGLTVLVAVSNLIASGNAATVTPGAATIAAAVRDLIVYGESSLVTDFSRLLVDVTIDDVLAYLVTISDVLATGVNTDDHS